MQSWVYYHAVIGLLCFEYGYLQKLEKECSWLVERDHCPFYGSTDWECLKARLNCADGTRYHCAKNETGSWVEVCDKGTVCSEGEEPVYLKDLSIYCEPCSDPERYQPFSKSSYTFSQCERKKKPCPEGISHECANEAGRYTQNRICMCTYKKNYIPQDYDFTKYKWVCADPDDLNCVAEACPESVDGKPQARGGDYRCSPSSPVTPSPTKNPNERSTTEHIPPTMTTVTESNGNNGRISGHPTAIVIVASLVILFLVILIVVLLLWMRFVLHRYKKLEPPSCFNIKGIWYTEVALEWQPPNSDDGCPVIGYILDQQVNESEYWTSVAFVPVRLQDKTESLQDEHSWGDENIHLIDNKENYKVKGLTAGTSYKFRVAAKNKNGVGSFLEMELAVKTKQYTEPDIPRNLTGYFDSQERLIKLFWEHPDDDGGKPLIAYRVEYCDSADVDRRWIKDSPVDKEITAWSGNMFVAGGTYKFRVSVQNAIGFSECQELQDVIQYLSLPAAPEDVLCSDLKNDRLMVNWKPPQQDGGTIIRKYILKLKVANEEWRVIADAPNTSTSKIVKCLMPGIPYYLGVCAENRIGIGELRETRDLVILPKLEFPSAPERLVAKPDKGFITLEWKPPISDGGSKCICFHIKKRKTNSQEWSAVTTVSDPTRTSLRVRAEPYCGMLYSISAENATGIGPAAVTETDVSSYGPPLVPAGYLTVSDYDANEATLKWAAPEHDGGAPLTRYRLEYAEWGRLRHGWKHSMNIPPNQTECCVNNLKANTKYSFRICAENEFGSSNLLEIEKPIKTRHLIVPPKPTGEILFEDSTEDYVRLSWQPPADEGSAVVRGYHVKYKLNDSNSKWINAGYTSDTTWKQDDLIPEHEYLFSVAATNAKGEGPALISEVIKPTTLHLDVMKSLAEELKLGMQGLTVLSGLKKFHIGSEEDHTHIQEASSAAARNERILQLISSKGFGAYKLFKGILFESEVKLFERLKEIEETIKGEGIHAGGTNVDIAEKDNNWSSLDSREDKHLPAGLAKSGFSQTYPSSSTKSASASVVSQMMKNFEQQTTPQSMSSTKGKTETSASEEAENNLDKPGEAGPYKTDATVSSKDWEMQEKEAHDYLGMLGVQKRSESWENFVTYTKPLEEIIKKTIEIPTCLPQQINGNKYKLGKQVLPKELRAYECSGEDNFLFRSVSCALFGNEEYTERLRLVSVFDGVNNYDVYAKQYFEDKDDEEIIEIMQSCISSQTLQEFDKDIKLQKDSANMAEMTVKMAVRETAISGSKINPFQVQFLSGAINIPILQYFQRNKNFFGEDINEYEIIKPAGSTDSIEDILHTCLRILWISDKKKEHSGSGNLNCILPVIKKPKK